MIVTGNKHISRDPSTGKAKLKIGTLTNIDAWTGFEIPEENYSVQVESSQCDCPAECSV